MESFTQVLSARLQYIKLKSSKLLNLLAKNSLSSAMNRFVLRSAQVAIAALLKLTWILGSTVIMAVFSRLKASADRSARRRLEMGRPRSIWAGTPILTLAYKSRADRALGFTSHSLVFTSYYTFKKFDFNLRLVDVLVAKLAPSFFAPARRIILHILMMRYDVFHYFFDRGILVPTGRFGINLEELDMLRAAGKRVYVYAYGADVRLREKTNSLGHWNFCVHCPEPGKYCICDDKSGAKILSEISSRVTATVAMGDMIAYLPSSCHVHYWPVDTEKVLPVSPSAGARTFRIAHAPNHTHFKGSNYLEDAIGKLRAEGLDIEYLKVQGVSNNEVIRIFGEADLIADQFIGGAYGYTALEAMARSKPVLTYVRSPDLVQAADECPLINTTPDNLEDVLRWSIENRELLPAIGAQGRKYIERWHSIEAVAARLGRMYEDTAEFSAQVLQNIRKQRVAYERWLSSKKVDFGWRHPFTVLERIPDSRISLSQALGLVASPRTERWKFAGERRFPTDTWHSYDRKPWSHPWMTPSNIGEFSAFSEKIFRDLGSRNLTAAAAPHSFAAVGNIANINYMRQMGLRRNGLSLDLFIDSADKAITSQPVWEDLDSSVDALGEFPEREILKRELPENVTRITLDSDWQTTVLKENAAVVDPRHVLLWPEFMPYLPGLQKLSRYDALIVSQHLFFGPLSGRPYIIGPMGGDIWFDAARNDLHGQITRDALCGAYAVIVSNPITLAHARRYGLKNVLYLPFCIDEERYRPGDEEEIRSNWSEMTGGDFFVLTSMRIDDRWKGSTIALEGFSQFCSRAPGARLIVLSWGVNIRDFEASISKFGIQDKVFILPMVGKVTLSKYLRAAHVLIEQFVLGYFGSSGLEAIASGLPVVMRLERAQYDALVPIGAPPVLDAETPAEVGAKLKSLYADPQLRKTISQESRKWFLKTHASSHNVDRYRQLMQAAARGLAIDWSGSPLQLPLTDAEQQYHADQLRNAPAFPVYEL